MDFNEKLNYLKGIGYNPGVGVALGGDRTRNSGPKTVSIPSNIPSIGFSRNDLDEFHRASPIVATDVTSPTEP